jgi:hypothetical protein
MLARHLQGFARAPLVPLAASSRYAPHVARSLLQRVHNPRNRACGCDSDCWCRRTALGRAVKWWFPGRYFGLHHKNRDLAEMKQSQDAAS